MRQKLSLSTITVLLLLQFILLPDVTRAASALPSPDKLVYPPLRFSLPQTERIVLPNGITLYFLEDRQLPLVSVKALINTGAIHDPDGKEGVAELTTYVMRTGGTNKLSSFELDNRFDSLAASPSVSTNTDFAQINFSFFSKDLDQALDLLSQVMRTPAFEESKFNLAKELKAEELKRIKDDPQKLAVREFNRILYQGKTYGRLTSLKSVRDIAREDLIKFHQRFFQPQNIMFSITGDLTREDAIQKIDRYFGNWLRQADNVNRVPVPHHSGSGLFYIKKEITQSTIIGGQLCPGKNSSDYYAFTVLDFIIGSGGFPSRIFSAIRNNEGLAYSAGSFYRARSNHGIFASYAFTKTDSTIKTLSLINSVLNDIRNNTITSAEIEWAKKSIDNSFIFSFTSPEQIAWQQMKIEYDGLPADFLIKYRSRIEKINIDEVNKVAKKYLQKETKTTVILGNNAKYGNVPADLGQPVIITPED